MTVQKLPNQWVYYISRVKYSLLHHILFYPVRLSHFALDYTNQSWTSGPNSQALQYSKIQTKVYQLDLNSKASASSPEFSILKLAVIFLGENLVWAPKIRDPAKKSTKKDLGTFELDLKNGHLK